MFRSALAFMKKETVLTAAAALALLSMFLVPPDAQYAGYIDFDTLALLFSLMAVMKGYQRSGLFDRLGGRLLAHVRSTRGLLLALVFLPFISSMVITNDVALITFVPFALIVLRLSGQERLLIPVVVMQTLAANLGSMLTPIGNPQNLYLYSRSGISFGGLCALMAPYVLLSGVCLAAVILVRRPAAVAVAGPGAASPARPPRADRTPLYCTALFALCLLALFDVLPPLAVAAVALAFLLLCDRPLLRAVDYSLLGTFVAFFIFIGNLGRMDAFRGALSAFISGREELAAVLASQVISNVPAALLLAGFTQDWADLIVGCNLGGLGTLIASMASLISYRQVAGAYPEQRGRYFLCFTAANIALLALLLPIAALL